MTGLELSRRFFHDVVQPLLARHAPSARYTAGRLGARSDAFGLDDEVSRDHGWGPGCTVLFETRDPVLDTALRDEMPAAFAGYPTAYPPITNPVEVWTAAKFIEYHIGAPTPDRLTAIDWLAVDEQKLAELCAGELFRDDLGVARVREQVAFYPDDVRLQLIAAEWTRIGDEHAFPGRAGSRGDDLGSTIVLARLVERAMRICHYLARRYPLYGKWFGTGFRQLGTELPVDVLHGADWEVRDARWARMLEQLIAMHETAGLLTAGRYRVGPVYAGRPGSGVADWRDLVDELRSRIADPALRALSSRDGSINQMFASRDVEEDGSRLRPALRALYRSEAR
jgi:hypothetical protein